METVVNLNHVPLESAAYSASRKGVNYTMAITLPLNEDILCWVEQDMYASPEETGEV
jgi:hypothetical protein